MIAWDGSTFMRAGRIATDHPQICFATSPLLPPVHNRVLRELLALNRAGLGNAAAPAHSPPGSPTRAGMRRGSPWPSPEAAEGAPTSPPLVRPQTAQSSVAATESCPRHRGRPSAAVGRGAEAEGNGSEVMPRL